MINHITLTKFLKEISGRGDFNGLGQYTIAEMLKNNIDSFVVSELTGHGDVMLQKCQMQVFSENKDVYINSKLINIGTAP
jgi:hypothetical protein